MYALGVGVAGGMVEQSRKDIEAQPHSQGIMRTPARSDHRPDSDRQ
jgi:hypothetical protein